MGSISATAFNIIATFLVIHRALAGINIIRTPQFGVLNFKRIRAHYLNVSRGLSTEVANFQSCANECRKIETCLSFNLEKNDDKTYCEVLQDDYCANKDKLVKDSSRQVYFIETQCCSGGCLNGGKCSMSYHAKQLCSCPDFYGGEFCENQVSKQYCNLYSDVDKLGDTIHVESDESLSHFNDKTASISCFGIWILYSDSFTHYSQNLLVESKGETLTNLEGHSMVRKASAIRPVGPRIDPFNKDWLVLYSRPQYFGKEFLFENDVGKLLDTAARELNDDAESAIMYGTSSWTLYDNSNYNGWSVCLKGRSDGKLKSYWSLARLDGANKVSSVKKGCHSSVIA